VGAKVSKCQQETENGRAARALNLGPKENHRGGRGAEEKMNERKKWAKIGKRVK
jgi:hypothetical protein